jgi:membrane-bound serine protease (ClpP class)
MNKIWGRFSVISLIVLVMAALSVLASDPNNLRTTAVDSSGRNTIAVVIPCSGMIDDGLYQSIKRRTQIALDGGAAYVIYEISTYGGLVQSADDIAKYFIHEVSPKADTVAYVATEAISAGAMISVSCKDIIMRTNTTIGDCAPIEMGGKLEGVEREKAESFIRAAFERAAEANKYPKALLKAMVSQRIEVWRIKNIKTGEYVFCEGEQLPKDANEYDLAGKQLVDSKDDILTLTASKAFEYGITRAVVSDRAGALAFLEKRDNVTFKRDPVVLETNWSEEMVRILNHPVATGLLFMIGLLGIYLELSSPGLSLPGLVAVICFAVLFGSKYLVGLANWVEVAIFFFGVLLLLVELLFIPGFGVTGILGILFMATGLLGMFVHNPPGKLPIPQTSYDMNNLIDGILTLGAGLGGSLAIMWLFGKHFAKMQFFSGLVLKTAPAGPSGELSMTAPPESSVIIQAGDKGIAVSTLRPAGKARFGDAIVDVVAEGEWIHAGSEIIVVLIEGVRVVVRKI